MNNHQQPSNISAEKDSPDVWFARGIVCMENGNYSDAEMCFRQSRALAPDSLEALLNLGYALDMQGRADAALCCYNKVLVDCPGNVKARYNRASHLLRVGDLLAGFSDYEARFAAIKNADSRVYTQPRWDGSPLSGRTILVYCEQGFGDTLMFARYIPFLAERGAHVILEVQQPLIPLLDTMEAVTQTVIKSSYPPVTDVHIPLLSLPFVFQTTLESIPNNVPYLSPQENLVAGWKKKVRRLPGILNVGLVWSGKAYPDPNRSCKPEHLASLLVLPCVRFYSLQVGEAEHQPLPRELADKLVDLTDNISNFADTAALIAALDLVITIDTAVAHLAGALGKTVWVMLPAAADWRWMQNRSDSLWYPTMRLFRQRKPGDWASVVEEVVHALQHHFEQHSNVPNLEIKQEKSFQRALEAIENNRPDSAIVELLGLLQHLPDEAAVWFNLGRAYDMAGRMSDAENAYKQALLGAPNSPALWSALGEIRLKQKAYPEAEFCLRKAHALKPGSIEILLSLGGALSAQQKKYEAMDCCQKVLVIKPDCVEAIYNMSFIQLRNGDYKRGFANFEARLAIEKFDIDHRRYSQPLWDGAPLNGKSILVYGEQGLGDVIQFARYLPYIAERGGNVVFEVDPPLIPLFDKFPGVSRIVAKSNEPPVTDVYIRSLSLPYVFGTTAESIPNRIPYIFPDKAKVATWQQRLGKHNDFRIGLVWRGNPNNPRDKERSCSLNTFAPLAGRANVRFYSLQVGEAALEVASPPDGMDLVDCSNLLPDLTETAALVANLDLIICVDTSVAHMAGAMGQLVWVLLPEGSEWRWLEGRDDTPWYPTMRVFEHKQQSDWAGIILRVQKALDLLLAERKDRACHFDLDTTYAEATSLKEAGDLDAAEYCFRQIVEQHPNLPDPHYGLGVVLQLKGKVLDALEHYRIATDLDPGFVKAHYNLAISLLRCGRYPEALASAQKTIECDPTHADAHMLLGMLLLQNGDFLNGWKEYEWRWKAHSSTSRIPDLGRPLWDGSPLEGKTLLIHMEQGRGDMIQFIRYAPLAAALGGKIVACAVSELVSLVGTSTGISSVADREGILPDFDVHIPVQSLPYLFRTTLATVPDNVPYLHPTPEAAAAWAEKLSGDRQGFRIGLVWAGNEQPDANRSCRLENFAPLFSISSAVFYSLQIGQKEHFPLGSQYSDLLIDHTENIENFSDTAALMNNLDLIISIDTASAHLAGALGKPVWTLLPFVPEWRWLLERDDSLWYPTMRLFRQTSAGDWQSVLLRVRDELELLLGSATALNQLGITLLRSGAAERAEQVFSRAIIGEPGNAQSMCNRGVALDSLRKFDLAIKSYQGAVAIKPDFVAALLNMGNAYVTLGRLEEARTCYRRVIEVQPTVIAAYIALGDVERSLQNYCVARTAYVRATTLDPDCAEAFRGIGDIDLAEERFEHAVDSYRRATELRPDNAAVFNLMGAAYQSNEQLVDAEKCYCRALTIVPDYPTALNNLGVVLDAQGRRAEAVAVYRSLLDRVPEYAEGHWNLAVALLALGNYTEGWQEFEWRFKKANPVPSRNFSEPLWDGSNITGKTILLHAEQGFGDTLQFVRYVPLLVQQGVTVILECQIPTLKRLLQSLQGIAGVFVAGEPLPLFDCHLPLMSLPRVYGTTVETIPCPIPYLAAESQLVNTWHQSIEMSKKFKVGVVWYAKQSQVLNRKRSCPLNFFSPLWDISGVDFYSLQIGVGTDQLEDFASAHKITDLSCEIHDFADTAAFMANLDLVITIDTAVAHLAGALGIRTWVVLPHVAEWRWLHQRSDSPWYPTLRLFRQPSQGNWPSLMNSVAATLRDCVKETDNFKSVRHGNPPQLLVGLAWSGRQDNLLDWRRSCPFSALKPLLCLPNIRFVKLQLDLPDSKPVSDPRLINLTEHIHDFEDTAALMAHLDLIISVDTAVAHLAAATGRPTWLLLSHAAEWRWLTGREDSPWYPSMLLFRQSDHGDWAGVIQAVTDRLADVSCNRLCRDKRVVTGSPNGGCSQERQRLENQLKEHEDCVVQDRTCADAHINLGATLALCGRYREAAASFRRALQLNPGYVSAHLNLAYALLATGEYLEGWHHFEWRLQRIDTRALPPWPMLQPESLRTHPIGTSLLVHCEQGFGDTIQFCRFLPMLAEAGYIVTVSCQPSMVTLVQSIPGVRKVIAHGELLPMCDLQVLLLSLLRLFSVNPESQQLVVPYLLPGKQKLDTWGKLLNRASYSEQAAFFSKEFSATDDMC